MAGLLLVLTAICAPVPAAEPAQGKLLVATPEMNGSWFAEAVILLVQHDDFGSVGLIVNRRTDMAPADLLPSIAELRELQSKLYIGGPVARHGVMMLVKSDEPPGDAEHVFANVYASGSQELLRDMAGNGDSADRVRLYAGYAGWVPGQLEAEIRRGSWIVVPAAENLVFSSDPDGVWDSLAPSSRPIIVQRADAPTRL